MEYDSTVKVNISTRIYRSTNFASVDYKRVTHTYTHTHTHTHTLLCLSIFQMKVYLLLLGLSDIGVTCSPRDRRFAGSNPAENDGFFQDVKIQSTSPPGGTLSWVSRV